MAENSQTYTIAKGDTLSALAKQFYGDAKLYNQLAKYNNIENPDVINVGDTITLPRNLLRKKTVQQVSTGVRMVFDPVFIGGGNRPAMTEIEVWVEGEDGPRKVHSNGTLAIVPDLVLGRKVKCKTVDGSSVVWRTNGYVVEEKEAPELQFTVRGWPKVIRSPWFAKEAPKALTIIANDRKGHERSVGVKVYTGTSETLEIDLSKSSFYTGIKQALEILQDAIKASTGKKIEIKFLVGNLAFASSFEEDKSVEAFYSYDLSAGFSPFFSVGVTVPFGLSTFIPQPLARYADYLKFELSVDGGCDVILHFKRQFSSPKPKIEGEISLKVGVEITGGAEISRKTLKGKEYTVIDAKLGAATDINGNSIRPVHDEKGLGVKATIEWSGVKLEGYIKALDGLFTYKKEIVLIAEKTLVKDKVWYFINEKS